MLFPAHERFLIGRDSHGISAIYLIIYIADIPSAVVAQPSSAAVVAQPSPAVGSLLYVRPLTTSYHFIFLFSIKSSMRHHDGELRF